tara:strand:+ start:1102 stop:1275 length:174 start_codon:yes stop_codon:yes gene_type:complete
MKEFDVVANEFSERFRNKMQAIEEALIWFGIDGTPEDCDVCENGAVYYGLTMIISQN